MLAAEVARSPARARIAGLAVWARRASAESRSCRTAATVATAVAASIAATARTPSHVIGRWLTDLRVRGAISRGSAGSLSRRTFRILQIILILFDIDGTLLLGAPLAHTEALSRAAADVFEVPVTAADVVAIHPGGRTDQEIARLILRRHDVDDARITAGLDAWKAHTVEVYSAGPRRSPSADEGPRSPRGPRPAAATGARLALLTGNLEPLAHAKVGDAGLGSLVRTGHRRIRLRPRIPRRPGPHRGRTRRGARRRWSWWGTRRATSPAPGRAERGHRGDHRSPRRLCTGGCGRGGGEPRGGRRNSGGLGAARCAPATLRGPGAHDPHTPRTQATPS